MRKAIIVGLIGVSLSAFLMSPMCEQPTVQKPKSASGVTKVDATVRPVATFKGKKVTLEQFNILTKYEKNNDPTAVKHLYVVSANSGDCLLYSTVRGKVTSSGKRLTPYSIVAGGSRGNAGRRVEGIPVAIGSRWRETNEVLQDDGTYGSSNKYLIWSDARGSYHEHYVSASTFVHISETPMTWPKVILNLETLKEK